MPVRRVNVHHLHLTLRMINGALLVGLRCVDYLLTAIWALVPLLEVASIDYLLLVSLEDLRRVRSYRTTAPLLETKASSFWLRAEGDSILCLVNLMMHLTCFVPAVDIETCRPGNIVIGVIMLHIDGVVTLSVSEWFLKNCGRRRV